jgi:hypothetical protein
MYKFNTLYDINALITINVIRGIINTNFGIPIIFLAAPTVFVFDLISKKRDKNTVIKNISKT